jgi:hypothetical protein
VVGVLVGPGLLWPPLRQTWKAVGLEFAIRKLNLLVPSENLSIF